MKILLNDINCKKDLYPFTSVRSAADIRIGILTIREKWERILNEKVYTLSEIMLRENEKNDAPVFPANLIPSKQNVPALLSGETGADHRILEYPWNIFQYNDKALREDFELVCSNRISQVLSSTNKVTSPENIFVEEGAMIEHCILNASKGPIYIGKNAEIMEGCLIRGPFAICEGSGIKMGAKIYAATTIGPYCLTGGEIKNTVFFGHSNKAHDGYLGDSVIGEWCNLGAGTSNSNLKNTAGIVKAWSESKKKFLPVDVKCGLMMGDYSRSAINTSFNTGTVVGICSNIIANGFPPKYIPDFMWGDQEYILENVLKDINNWKKLKDQQITEEEIKRLTDIYYSQKISHA